MKTYLSNEQVNSLNEKHGWFEFGDAQSNVSRAFAQDAIVMHERMRTAAPELFAVVVDVLELGNKSIEGTALIEHLEALLTKAYTAYDLATREPLITNTNGG